VAAPSQTLTFISRDMLAALIEESAQSSLLDEQLVDANPTGNPHIRECDKLLCQACQDGDLAGVREALKRGADPCVRFLLPLGKITPMFMCASSGRMDIAQLLVNANKTVIDDIKVFDGASCLHYAASRAQPEMCSFLLERGVLVDKQDRLGRTPLMDAAEVGCIEALKVLLESGADVHLRDKNHHPAMAYCLDFVSPTDHKFYNVTLSLVQQGADCNIHGKFTRKTLLHHVAERGDLEFVRRLVEDDKVLPTPIDDKGKTPLDYAIESKMPGCTEVSNYLEKAATESGSCECIIL